MNSFGYQKGMCRYPGCRNWSPSTVPCQRQCRHCRRTHSRSLGLCWPPCYHQNTHQTTEELLETVSIFLVHVCKAYERHSSETWWYSWTVETAVQLLHCTPVRSQFEGSECVRTQQHSNSLTIRWWRYLVSTGLLWAGRFYPSHTPLRPSSQTHSASSIKARSTNTGLIVHAEHTLHSSILIKHTLHTLYSSILIKHTLYSSILIKNTLYSSILIKNTLNSSILIKPIWHCSPALMPEIANCRTAERTTCSPG